MPEPEPAPAPDTTTTTVDLINLMLPLLVPDTLLEVNTRNEGISASVPFTAQLLTLTEEVTETISAIGSARATPTTEINSQFNDTRFNNILSFSLQGTETIMASAEDTELGFFFSINSERAIHLLQQDDTVTLRRVDLSGNSVFQAKIVTLTNSTVIAADLNTLGIQSYLEAYSTDQFTAVVTQHPTDTSVPRQRELIDPTGTIFEVQNCTGPIEDCSSDSDFSNTDADIGLQFLIATRTFAAALSEPGNAPSLTLPDNVNEAVITATANLTPTEDQIQCGLQRVDNNTRFFCLRPLPLESDINLFSETVSGGAIFYQALQ